MPMSSKRAADSARAGHLSIALRATVARLERELQIEAALERVRASALAMRTSEDLVKVADTLKEQMGLLGQHQLESVVIEFYDLHEDFFESWYSLVPAARKDMERLIQRPTQDVQVSTAGIYRCMQGEKAQRLL